MNKRIGRYVVQKFNSESYKAYIPSKLPPNPPIDLSKLYNVLERANISLTELNIVHKTIPNTSLFIYMYLRKEALISSQIEGTQSSFSDVMLFENNQTPNVSLNDVEEVSNYVKAIKHGLNRLNSGFPVSLRLLKEMHAILLSGCRGSSKTPGEFRKSQNWIGGTRPSNALFVPPPIDYLDECLNDFEKFLHDETLPILIKVGIAHVQFETIHPFLDGNGRLGRVLITLLLCVNGLIDEPILYLSLYLKENRQTYFNLLQEVRERGTWETWLEFFLIGVIETAKEAIQTAKRINALFESDLEKISNLGRIKFSCEKIFDYMKKLPQVSVSLISKDLNLSAPTVRSSLNKMNSIGILKELTCKKRGKIYVYKNYLDILEKGAIPTFNRVS